MSLLPDRIPPHPLFVEAVKRDSLIASAKALSQPEDFKQDFVRLTGRESDENREGVTLEMASMGWSDPE